MLSIFPFSICSFVLGGKNAMPAFQLFCCLSLSAAVPSAAESQSQHKSLSAISALQASLASRSWVRRKGDDVRAQCTATCGKDVGMM